MEVFWLEQQACQDISLVGGKAANLSRLSSQNRVPPAFCLSASTEEVEPLILSIQKTGRTVTTTNELLSIVKHPYNELCSRIGGEEVGVAVRSSSTEEDSREASFAGQYMTFLNVIGIEAVVKAILRCLASFFSAQAVDYRTRKGLSIKESRLAVLVQQQVLADVSAVIFSANPVTGDRGVVVINASWGLGESVVSGSVTPDTYIVRKADLNIISRQISEKLLMTVQDTNGTKQVYVPRIMQKEPCIGDEQIHEMVQLALTLEKVQGWPVDIECVYQAKKLYLLQCRPITTLDGSEANS